MLSITPGFSLYEHSIETPTAISESSLTCV